jgi:hypothetical protein
MLETKLTVLATPAVVAHTGQMYDSLTYQPAREASRSATC